MIEFLLGLSALKRIPRSGWLSHGVSIGDIESVAEHTFSTCALSMMLVDLEAKRGVDMDTEKVLRMAVLHDLAESLTFDISQAYLAHMGKRGVAIKREVEEGAWRYLTQGLGNQKLAHTYRSLQKEYDTCATMESRIVHAADSLDILLQVIDYRRRGYPVRMLHDLWNERRKMVAESEVASAQTLLKMLIREYEKIS